MSDGLKPTGPGFRLKERISAFNKFKATFPTVAGQLAVNHFKKSFRDQGFTDAALVPWKPRKKNAPRNAGRNILTDTGDLKRSVKVKGADWNKITVGSDLKYAAIHNEGGVIERAGYSGTTRHARNKKTGRLGFAKTGAKVLAMSRYTVGAHGWKMPKRQFIGHSRVLMQKIVTKLKSGIDKIWRI